MFTKKDHKSNVSLVCMCIEWDMAKTFYNQQRGENTTTWITHEIHIFTLPLDAFVVCKHCMGKIPRALAMEIL